MLATLANDNDIDRAPWRHGHMKAFIDLVNFLMAVRFQVLYCVIFMPVKKCLSFQINKNMQFI